LGDTHQAFPAFHAAGTGYNGDLRTAYGHTFGHIKRGALSCFLVLDLDTRQLVGAKNGNNPLDAGQRLKVLEPCLASFVSDGSDDVTRLAVDDVGRVPEFLYFGFRVLFFGRLYIQS
jgi:hypothetical protein